MTHPWQPILDYWFGKPESTEAYFKSRNELWFGGSEATDTYIREHFSKQVEAASRNEFRAWENEPESCLALIILLDQFSMNLERDTRRCYERSAQVLPVARFAIKEGFDQRVHFAMRPFFYLPFEHSELMTDQNQSIVLFEKLIPAFPSALKGTAEYYLDFAHQHRNVIEKYGRFPGRNEVFGRKSTVEEQKYLDEGGWF